MTAVNPAVTFDDPEKNAQAQSMIFLPDLSEYKDMSPIEMFQDNFKPVDLETDRAFTFSTQQPNLSQRQANRYSSTELATIHE